MRIYAVGLVVIVFLVLGALVVCGCPKKSPAGGEGAVGAAVTPRPAATATEEEKDLARGKEIMAKYPDATEPPVNWAWDPQKPIDPATIPDEPVAGVMEGKLFVVKHVILMEDKKDKNWGLRFFDVEPPQDDKGNYYFSAERYVDLTLPNAGAGVKVNVPVDSTEWDIKKAWLWYQTPQETSPDGISINPGTKAMYVEFTEWNLITPAEGEEIIGSAKGKVACGGKMIDEKQHVWLAGTFQAVIAKPWDL